jgi:hypothetical protein
MVHKIGENVAILVDENENEVQYNAEIEFRSFDFRIGKN